MENKGKGPEKILAGFEKAYAPFIALPPHVKPFLMSSMANLLRWSAGQMSEKMRVDCDVLPLTVNVNNMGYNKAIDDCKATLLRLAEEICPK